MARRGILSTSLDKTLSSGADPSDRGETPAPPKRSASPRSGSPNVKRFRETFDDLRNQVVQEIDTDRIGTGRFRDRFDPGAEIDGLVASIRESGQQLPVLLRYAPDGANYAFEPVYGRRRIAACRRIGIPVKAQIADVDDEGLIVAQGLENSERLDTSFIEKAAFIVQLREAGFQPRVIERSLGIQGPEISRMTAVLRDLPDDLVTAIGPAHGIGRRQWLEMASLTKAMDRRRVQPIIKDLEEFPTSPERFAHALSRLKKRGAGASGSPETRELVNGRLRITARKKRVDIHVAAQEDQAFLDWLAERSEALWAQWQSEKVGGK